MKNLSLFFCTSGTKALGKVVLLVCQFLLLSSVLHAAALRPFAPRGTALLADPTVLSYTLVNADTDQDIQLLTDGAVLDLSALPTRNLNIRANTDPAQVGSVVFDLSGAQTQSITESVAPYALFSDFQGDYFNWTPAAGSYTLTATPYSEAGGAGVAGIPLTLSFSVLDPPANVVSFTLVNADTDTDIQPLTSGTTLNLTTLPTRNLNIRANVNSSPIGSVVFALSGAQTQNLTENSAPYALFSDAGGNYNPWTPIVGSYSLTATPYRGANATSDVGGALTISFSVIDPTGSVASFTLVNADTDQDIQPLTAGAVLNLATLPTRNLNIRANTSPATVGSVAFVLSGQQSSSITESVVPYAMFGDFQGDYNAWTPTVGTYSITATPFPAANGVGAAGTALTISFTVFDQTGPLPVKLTSFTIRTQPTGIEVSWTTASEERNREFVLERSLDGKIFRDIVTVAGHGTTSTTNHYRYLDTQVPTGSADLFYYRLRQIDIDGSTHLSPVRTVSLVASNSRLQVYPTVVTTGVLHVALSSEQAAGGQLELLTAQGRHLPYQSAGTPTDGTILTRDLPAGTYILRYTCAEGVFHSRFIVP
ncbi:T9SS type A sorting domain-containing protein [Hymenobacter aquaticus]|uniref:T9SS type A sorting domain-containing protein n=1 Tax=Hymenobacter aquaticus TaxID=1867101 RepID=A0A4Z0Q6M9_9BACT|nr:T9SS type A sorting domain-containing protein [Hymenobacter aquaticus]TGE25106.1 T9SS type A sorting domain-containing protein [Hymenobacter aquaticus]